MRSQTDASGGRRPQRAWISAVLQTLNRQETLAVNSINNRSPLGNNRLVIGDNRCGRGGRRRLAFCRFVIVGHIGSMPLKPKTPIGANPAQPARLIIDVESMENFEVGAGLVALLVCK